MTGDLTGKYFVRKAADAPWTDVTQLFQGLRVLKVDGMMAKGEPVNIYTKQWIDAQAEDFMVTKTGDDDVTPVVIRKNVDVEMTFIVRQKYATGTIDVMAVHDAFISYMTDSDVWVSSAYVGGKSVHCVCLSEYKPTTVKLERGDNSWVMGTLKLHCLDAVS